MDTSSQDPKDPISQALDVTPMQANVTILPASNSADDVDDDYEYARGNLINIIEKGNEALNGIMDVAERSQSARAYEVVAGIIKNMSEINKDLLELQKRKKDLQTQDQKTNPTTVNNNLFVGSTSELQKLLKKQRDGTD